MNWQLTRTKPLTTAKLPQSIPFLSAFGATNGEVTYSHTVKMSVFVMIWQIAALLVSIPFWSMMGLC